MKSADSAFFIWHGVCEWIISYRGRREWSYALKRENIFSRISEHNNNNSI